MKNIFQNIAIFEPIKTTWLNQEYNNKETVETLEPVLFTSIVKNALTALPLSHTEPFTKFIANEYGLKHNRSKQYNKCKNILIKQVQFN